MTVLLSFENVGVRYPVFASPPPARKGGARSMLRRLAYRPRVSRRSAPALRSIWLSVREGERLAILGPNGSGKTTMLRVMAGAIPHYSGRVTRFGETAAILSPQTGFQPHASGFENIFLRGLTLGLPRREVERRLDDIIGFAALGDWLFQPVSTYSSGMSLRLAFAVSTCIAPDILIMDEWIGAGDARFLHAASERIQGMVSSSRILVLASHNEKVLRAFCTRAIVLVGGAIVFSGPVPDALSFYGEYNGLASARSDG